MEQMRRRRPQRPGQAGPATATTAGAAAGAAAAVAADDAADGGVRVIHGPTMLNAALVGMTVGQARELFATSLGLDDGIDVVVDGEDATPDTRLVRGSTLEFVHRTGEKGAGAFGEKGAP